MNCEILFRGKRLDNSEWVEGGYYGDNKEYGLSPLSPQTMAERY